MDTLIETLRANWAEARAALGGMVHLRGQVGCGKSTQLGRFLEALGTMPEDAVIISARCGDRARVRSRDRGEIEALVARIAEGVRAIEVGPRPEDEGTNDEVMWLLPGGEFLDAAAEIASLPSLDEAHPPPSRAEIHAGLLMDVARTRSILLILDDAHRADPRSRALVDALAEALRRDPAVSLFVVLTTTLPLRESVEAEVEAWTPEPSAVVPLGPLEDEEIVEHVRRRLAAHGEPSGDYLDLIVKSSAGNPGIAEALTRVSAHAGAFRKGEREALDDANLVRRPEFAGLTGLAAGVLPAMPANVRADLQTAAVVGRRFATDLLAKVWAAPAAAAAARVEAIRQTGLIFAEGDGWAFVSEEIATHYAAALAPADRRALHLRVAQVLRAGAADRGGAHEPLRTHLDVTETWSETQRRDRRLREEQETLWAAARHFADAGQHAEAGEAAVSFLERTFESSGGHPYLAGRFGRRADRERRHRIYAVLTVAEGQLRLARTAAGQASAAQLVTVKVRLLNVHARFKEVMGDFAEARRSADMAVDLALHLATPKERLEAMRVQLEVCYAAGDANAAREGLVQLLSELERAPRDDAVRIYCWLAEAIGRWEWDGLRVRLFPFVLERLGNLGAHREAIKARMEWLSSIVADGEGDPVDALVEGAIEDAKRCGEQAYLAEELARYAADLIQTRVDAQFDLLSGEFYPPQLFATGSGPAIMSLPIRLAEPVRLLIWAQSLAEKAAHQVSHLRVQTTALGIIYETRERCADLLDRWMPVQAEAKSPSLDELVDLLQRGFFEVTHIETLSESIVNLAGELGLHQVMADTLYEALDRELPAAMQRSGTLFEVARKAYQDVGDAYGLITLSLVQARLARQAGEDAVPAITAGLAILEENTEQLSVEQQAFVRLRFGELALQGSEVTEAAVSHLEHAIRLYDQVGDVEHVQAVGEVLREVYRKTGDLGRYRALRERFRAMELKAPGVDPLGLELRIEHQLTRARQEPNDERAIEMVEHCVHLFGRMPDGTTRIDECFVEISKICRRRADEATSEAGFADWLRRSLEAVRIAASINRSLGNYHRVFEEYHELFDDLLGLGYFDEYVRARAENRELAFAVGNISELLYLFEEHLQYDAEEGMRVIRLPEVRGFYEALIRYLLGLGAIEHATRTQHNFVAFLTALGEVDLAEYYRNRQISS